MFHKIMQINGLMQKRRLFRAPLNHITKVLSFIRKGYFTTGIVLKSEILFMLE
jgi:hypothetical protein